MSDRCLVPGTRYDKLAYQEQGAEHITFVHAARQPGLFTWWDAAGVARHGALKVRMPSCCHYNSGQGLVRLQSRVSCIRTHSALGPVKASHMHFLPARLALFCAACRARQVRNREHLVR